MTVFKVKEISKYITTVLRRDAILSNIKVEGEVSNFRKSGGHIYFDIKDEDAMLKCVVFKSVPISSTLNLTDGSKVVVTGAINTYEKGSYYQVQCKNVEEVGIGNLFEEFLKLKEKLKNEGLFNDEFKKEIPKYPKNIGIVTASNGAVIRDIMNTLNRRYKIANTYLYPAKVQGVGSSDELINGIEYLSSLDFIDVIIIGRGGGSFEDLNSFNDESLARAIFKCKKPIISAVGHEVDVTISDFVADKRASTPTAGAEMVATSIGEIMDNLNFAKTKLNDNIDELFFAENTQLEHFFKELNYYSPFNKFENIKEKLAIFKKSLDDSIKRVFENQNNILKIQKKSLDMINPDNILNMGYSIVHFGDKILNNVNDININDKLNITLSNGEVITEVREIKNVN